jgi:nicotinate phosphoribosyltransferase
LKLDYLDFLSAFSYKPDQIRIEFVPQSPDGDTGNIEIEAVGTWAEAIFWEVPLMASLSEIYFKVVESDWCENGQAGGC